MRGAGISTPLIRRFAPSPAEREKGRRRSCAVRSARLCMDATERRQCLVPANISARRANWEGFDSGRDPFAVARNNAGMAEIPFVDTHFHLHDMKRPELRYSWLERDAIHGFLGNIDALKAQRYWIDDYLAEIRFANVPKAIHVQAALGTPDPVNETKWLQAFADATGYPQGIVAGCHLADADAEVVLERHMQYANVRVSEISERPLSRRSRLGVPATNSSAPQPCLLHRHAHSVLRRSARPRRHFSRDPDLRRPLGDPRRATTAIFGAGRRRCRRSRGRRTSS